MTNGGGWSCLIWIGILFLFAVVIRFMIVSDRRQGEGNRLKSIFPHPAQLEEALVYTISLPRGIDWEPQRAHSFVQHILSSGSNKLAFRIMAEKGNIAWQIADLKGIAQAESLARGIRTIYPEAEVVVDPYEPPALTTTIWRFVDIYRLYNFPYVPIRLVDDAKKDDPLVALVQAMTELEEGERIIYTVYVGGDPNKEDLKKLRKSITEAVVKPLDYLIFPGTAMAASIMGAKTKPRYQDDQQKRFEEKINGDALSHVYLMIQLDMAAPYRVERATDLAAILTNQFSSDINALWPIAYSSEKGGHAVKPLEIANSDVEQRTSAVGVMSGWASGKSKDMRHARAKAVLGTREIATLWHLPHEGFTAGDVVWSKTSVAAPAQLISRTEGVHLGYNASAGKTVNVYLPDEDRYGHTSIVGMTGVGKSTLMHNLIQQDIARGMGIAVIDPHGDLVADILRASIPDGRQDDVVVLDIAQLDYPPPLNPLLVPQGTEQKTATGIFKGILDRVYNLSETPRIAETITAVLGTLSLETTPTLHDVARLFEDADYRHRLLKSLGKDGARKHRGLVSFWASYDSQSAGAQRELAHPVEYRMRTFFDNHHLHAMLCHPQALDFSEMINSGKIILISLNADEGQIPADERRLLGSILVSKIQLAALQSSKDKPPFFFYIDEAQYFVTTAIDQMLSEMRKRGVYLTLANQFLGQITGSTLDAVMGTVHNHVAFKVGPPDARVLAPYFKPEFTAEDLVHLDLHQAAAKLRLDGNDIASFTLDTREAPGDASGQQARDREQQLRASSRSTHTPMSRDAVFDWLDERYPLPDFMTDDSESGDKADGEDEWTV